MAKKCSSCEDRDATKKDGLCDTCRDEEDSPFKLMFTLRPKTPPPSREVIDENVKRNKPWWRR